MIPGDSLLRAIFTQAMVDSAQRAGVTAMVVGRVDQDELLPGETGAEAMARLHRAVVISDEPA